MKTALRRPALIVLLIAPFLGETLSTATPPLDLILPWRFPLVVALYGRTGLTIAGLALVAVLPVTYADFVRVPAGQFAAAAGLCALLVMAALLTSRSAARPQKSRPRLAGLLAFAATATHFILVYTVAATGLAWPLGTAAALAPIAVAALLIRRLGAGGGLWVVTGILGFFLILDAVVGLGGRYDLTVGALAAAFGLWRLHKLSDGNETYRRACYE
ncbi:hypothetical protein OWR29_01010 [Actinoplanes sp. Pm04-4]|uniref:Uncharacterized protein n=1 Tax=Paractinoplanes pyxinae TaxID=2997416 RepID=A0ABT4AQM8_9ACTN|nr:hypothetical protein [Actinoplanes pyxinae]MCY1136559.1 hypothetical protein [Actinoplanes pyxinae]